MHILSPTICIDTIGKISKTDSASNNYFVFPSKTTYWLIFQYIVYFFNSISIIIPL